MNKAKPKAFAALCGRIFRDADPQYFPSAEHRGRAIHFCTDACLGAFLSDPDVFYNAHRNSDKTASRAKAGTESLVGIWRKHDPSTKSN